MKRDDILLQKNKEVVLSPKYQVVIPKRVREQLNFKPGMRFMIIPYEGRAEIVPLEDIRDLHGAYPGIDTTIVREPDRV